MSPKTYLSWIALARIFHGLLCHTVTGCAFRGNIRANRCRSVLENREICGLARFAKTFLFALALPVLHAAPAELGVIAGRVFNPSSGEYVRNVRVSIAGGQSAVTEDGGYYRISGVSPGNVTLEVSYTGYERISTLVSVLPGQTVTRDFELTSSLLRADATQPVMLGEFVVSSEREGNAKAIMDQRQSMNITNTVASDVFGDVAEGNVGEFLKHLPGIDGDIEDGTMRYVRLRGLPAEYTSVTIDGSALASADANVGSAANARAFSFEQASLSSVESIEVLKTVSADVEANAPAGTINLKTKRAFDRRGRRVMAQANFTLTSWQFDFDRSLGPDDTRRRKALPGGIFEYSDVFLSNRLGLILNLSESNFYSVRTPTNMTYNYAPTAADPRPAVLTQIRPLHNARTSERFTTTVTADYKATPNLALSLGLVYNTSDLWSLQRGTIFNAGPRTTVVGTDPLNSFTTASGAGTVTLSDLAIAKLGKTLTYLPKFEYRKGDFTLEGKFTSSASNSTYDPKGRRGAVFGPGAMALSGVTFQATRSAFHEGDWTFRQTGGPDWSRGDSFSSPTVIVDDGRYARMEVLSGDVAATLKTNVVLPVVWKSGVKMMSEHRRFEFARQAYNFSYTGPGAGLGAWRDYRSPFVRDFGAQNVTVASVSGGDVFMPNLLQLGRLYREHPEYFTQSLTATNYYNAYIANKKDYREEMAAAFFMGTATWRKTTFRAGLRWEATETDALEHDALSSSEVRAAGFPVSAGRATTIPGIEYQYLSRPQVHRTGEYDYFFPSASIKHRFREKIDLHLGYSKTIRRPSFNNVAGVWNINDDNLTVTAPNPDLEPELSHNYSARLAYYFEPVGLLGINVFQNTIEGKHLTNVMTADEFGYAGDLDLSAYTFRTTTSRGGETRVRGMEFEYSQSLSFLPRPFRGLNVRGSYTRNYSQVITPNMAPHLFTGGLGYAFGRANVAANVNWGATAPTNAAGTNFQRHRLNLDASGGYRFTPRFSVFVNVRNVLNTPHILMQRNGTNPMVATTYQVFGTTWTFGLKGAF